MNIEIFGIPFWIDGIEGEVRGLQNWSTTSVTSSGNGTATHLGGGNYQFQGPKVTTTTTQNQTFWVVTPSGHERQISGNYPLREGQKIAVVWGSVKGANATGHLLVRNLTTATGWTNDEGLPGVINRYGWRKLFLSYLAGLVIVSILMLVIVHATPADIVVFTVITPFIAFIHLNFLVRRNQKKRWP